MTPVSNGTPAFVIPESAREDIAARVAVLLSQKPKSATDLVKEWLPVLILGISAVTGFTTLKVTISDLSDRVVKIESTYVPIREHQIRWDDERRWRENVDTKLDKLIEELAKVRK